MPVAYQAVFKRYEIKYMLTREQKERLLQVMESHMVPDGYGRSTIRNIYFDTDNYRLIRRSIERPAYKEKLRIRSYTKANADTPVFVELKKKYQSVVYKRRLSLPEAAVKNWIQGLSPGPDCQIAREIDYVRSYYGTLHPVVYLSYEREAYYSRDGDEFRITFDDNILCRQEELTMMADVWGTPLLEEGRILMELKTPGGIPLWMTRFLTREHIYKTSFSKYGTAYQTLIYPQQNQGGVPYA